MYEIRPLGRRAGVLAVFGVACAAIGLAGDRDASPIRAATPHQTEFAATDMGNGVLDFTAGKALDGVRLPGAWWTFANGDDVLAMAIEGDLVWAGTRAGGLVRWDRRDGKYVQYLRPQDPLAANTIRDIEIDAAGRKWLASTAGLTVFQDGGTATRDDDRWYTFTQANSFGGLPTDDVHAVTVRGNEVWVGTHQVQDPETLAWSGGGLAKLDHKGVPGDADDTWAPVTTFASTKSRLPNGTDVFGLVSDNINALAFTPAGRLWVGTAPFRIYDPENVEWPAVHGGLSALDTKGTPATNDDTWAGFSCEDAPLVVSCYVLSLSLDDSGWLWAGTRGRGLMFFQASGNFLGSDGDQRYTRNDGLPDNDVPSVVQGPAGSHRVFVATSGGLGVIDHAGTLRNRNDDTVVAKGAPDGLSRDVTQALAVQGADLWVGTGPYHGVGGGVNRLDAGSLQVRSLFATSAAVAGGGAPTSNFIRDLDFGAIGTRWEGHVWAATGSAEQRLFGEGVFDLDTQGTESLTDDMWKAYTVTGTDDNARAPFTGLAGNNVHAVLVDQDAVWFGAAQSVWNATARKYDDGGLSVFDGSRWSNRTAQPMGLTSNGVSSLARGCDGRLWIGLGNKWEAGLGVNIVQVAGLHTPATDVWQAVRYPQLASNQVSAVATDCSRPMAWVSALHHVRGGRWSDGGAARYDVAANAWTAFDTLSGLTSYAVDGVKAEGTSVLAGPNGSAWVGAFGTEDTSQATLIQTRPFWPAVVNAWNGTTWSNEVFRGAGWVSSLALDQDGHLWAALSRGGAARDSLDPENWREDRTVPGLLRKGEGDWEVLDTGTGLPANDVSVVDIDPNGDIWVGTEGWGFSVYRPRSVAPTPTPTSGASTPTPTATSSAATPTRTLTAGTPTATPSGTRPTLSASPTPTRVSTRPPQDYLAYLPVCYQADHQ